MTATWLHMGTLTHPHGIKGEICVIWYAESPLFLRMPLWLECAHDVEIRRMTLISVRYHKGQPLVAFEGIADRNAAQAICGGKLLVRKDDLPKPAEDEVYVQDIIGHDVFLSDGRRLGRLDHVEYPAGREIWAIATDDGCEVLFPVRAEFIVRFDKQNSSVYICPPAGLIEIYLGNRT